MSLFLYNKHILINAAKEGTRAGILIKKLEKDGTRDDSNERQAIKDRVILFAQTHLVTFGSDVLDSDDIEVDPDPLSFEFGDDLEVKIKYQYDFLYLSLFMGPIDIWAHSKMFME